MTLSRYDLLQSINARGAWVVSKYAIPYLKKAKNPHILTLSPPLSMDPHWFNGRTAYTMSKYGMSMTVLGLSAELEKYGIGVNALWPLTTIGTAALIIVRKTNPDLINRTPEIMADAAHVILTSNSKECTGNFFIDEVVLREYGVRDFSKYIETPGTTDADMTLDGYIEESTLKHLAHLRNIQSRL
ncbi:Hydroxysteroid dehydrogenase-like protein 2 [Zancudomyces culisetae]|nr:Hydroxysteroid dehydrogenase-like protein 2 [Zancudomyces culisetae]|eukprot:OMH80631.1 Hydroxysteroid dehydrogenase-like protein 2 [Zancudomyces culisetae]